MKVCLFQSYSANNQALFDLTVGNHLKYCAKNNYTVLFDNGPYSAFINCHLVKALLQEYDFVFTAGSDCIFTSAAPIVPFLDTEHDVGIQEEGIGFSWLNGEVNLFRASDRCIEYLNHLYVEQSSNPTVPCGTQGLLNTLLKDPPEWAKTVQVIPAGKIQKYLLTGSRFPFQRQLWTPGTLIAHACGMGLQRKFAACDQFLKSGNVRL